MDQPTAPLGLAHVGLTVPDLDAGMEWYARAFALQPLDFRIEVAAADSAELERTFADLYDERATAVRIGFLATASGAAIELFEWDGPEYRPPDLPPAYDRGGVWHVGFHAPDIEGVLDWVEANGGGRRSLIFTAFPDQPYRYAFCADPWGNVIELQTHTLVQMFANQT